MTMKYKKYKDLVDHYLEFDNREENYQNRIIIPFLESLLGKKLDVVDTSGLTKEWDSRKINREKIAGHHTPDILVAENWKLIKAEDDDDKTSYKALIEVKTPTADGRLNALSQVNEFLEKVRFVILTDSLHWEIYDREDVDSKPIIITLEDEDGIQDSKYYEVAGGSDKRIVLWKSWHEWKKLTKALKRIMIFSERPKTEKKRLFISAGVKTLIWSVLLIAISILLLVKSKPLFEYGYRNIGGTIEKWEPIIITYYFLVYLGICVGYGYIIKGLMEVQTSIYIKQDSKKKRFHFNFEREFHIYDNIGNTGQPKYNVPVYKDYVTWENSILNEHLDLKDNKNFFFYLKSKFRFRIRTISMILSTLIPMLTVIITTMKLEADGELYEKAPMVIQMLLLNPQLILCIVALIFVVKTYNEHKSESDFIRDLVGILLPDNKNELL